MKRFASKDPAEQVVLAFDFSGEASALTSPSVVIEHDSGDADSNPPAMLSGMAQVDSGSAKVLQKVVGGIDGANYVLRCTATDESGLVRVRAGLLAVRKA